MKPPSVRGVIHLASPRSSMYQHYTSASFHFAAFISSSPAYPHHCSSLSTPLPPFTITITIAIATPNLIHNRWCTCNCFVPSLHSCNSYSPFFAPRAWPLLQPPSFQTSLLSAHRFSCPCACTSDRRHIASPPAAHHLLFQLWLCSQVTSCLHDVFRCYFSSVFLISS